jgi:hypothetical protein
MVTAAIESQSPTTPKNGSIFFFTVTGSGRNPPSAQNFSGNPSRAVAQSPAQIAEPMFRDEQVTFFDDFGLSLRVRD